jgi:hypothetical protein
MKIREIDQRVGETRRRTDGHDDAIAIVAYKIRK